jgi:hypothetical protein
VLPIGDNKKVMFRAFLAIVILAGVSASVVAQQASAPLWVTANVVSSCRVGVQRTAELTALSTFPVNVTCTRGLAAARVQHPIAPRRVDLHDAVLVINF